MPPLGLQSLKGPPGGPGGRRARPADLWSPAGLGLPNLWAEAGLGLPLNPGAHRFRLPGPGRTENFLLTELPFLSLKAALLNLRDLPPFYPAFPAQLVLHIPGIRHCLGRKQHAPPGFRFRPCGP